MYSPHQLNWSIFTACLSQLYLSIAKHLMALKFRFEILNLNTKKVVNICCKAYYECKWSFLFPVDSEQAGPLMSSGNQTGSSNLPPAPWLRHPWEQV